MTVGCPMQPPFLGRTWLPVLLLAASAHCHWPSEPADVVRDWEHQLEASMHSVLSDLREAVPAVVGIPDSSAVVGRFFRVSIPTDLIASNGEIVQDLHGAAVPRCFGCTSGTGSIFVLVKKRSAEPASQNKGFIL